MREGEKTKTFFLEKHAYQTPMARKSRNICTESIILLAQIVKEFILHLPPMQTVATA